MVIVALAVPLVGSVSKSDSVIGPPLLPSPCTVIALPSASEKT